MRRRGLPAVLLVAAVLATGPIASAAPGRTGSLVLAGRGGQAVTLAVPRGGLVVRYPFFTDPRLPGPDGTISGVVIQRARDGRLVGGVLLMNAPGFDRAVPITLVDDDHTVLAEGRYRFTLLGTGRKEVRLTVLSARTSRRLVARGPARPITRVVASTSPVASTWSDSLGRIGASDYVVTGAGSGGALQQASEDDLCLEPQGATAGPCLLTGGFTITPGGGSAGTWSGYQYRPGQLKPGGYVFTGNAVGAGPESATAHAAVVISLRT